jgi:hypothetical protein
MRLFAYLLLLCPLAAIAHVGSPNVFYEGTAGPYALRVVVRPPEVIPGRAQITVRALDSNVRKVSVLPARWDTGTGGAPAPDPAKPVRGDTNLFATELWLMNSGAYSILVNAEGPAGTGTTVVPINSIATARRDMPKWFGGMLSAWAGFLVIAMVSLVGAATRESVLQPGETPDRRRLWRSRGAMVVGAIVICTALWGGKRWWDSVDRDYRRNRLYRADRLQASLRTNASQHLMVLKRNIERWGGREVVPEHGKLMHAFLVRQPDLDAFAHLHPLRIDDRQFETALPSLPAGAYKVYADITHESGFTQTLVSDIELGGQGIAAGELSDPDDSWHISTNTSPNVVTSFLRNGYEIRLLSTSDSRLQFSVVDAKGQPAALEPYMDMQAHAIIHSADATVFTHLHPFGTVSMTSQQLFAQRERERNGKPFEVVCGLPARSDAISFPYEFPKPGRYRIWVQVKIQGEIMTGIFDTIINST